MMNELIILELRTLVHFVKRNNQVDLKSVVNIGAPIVIPSDINSGHKINS